MGSTRHRLTAFAVRGDYVDGRFAGSSGADEHITVVSPADADDLVSRHPVTAAHIDEAVAAARRAQPGFRRLSALERAALLRAYQRAVERRRGLLSEAIAREAGKPLWEAQAEVSAVLAKVDLTLGEGAAYAAPRALPDLPGRVEQRPLGVLAVIGPFNFPAHLPNGQIAPALATGNAVIFKPSEKTPTPAMLLAECVDEAGFPPGVFQLLQGGRDISARLAAHDGVDGVLFTGSYAAGRAISVANAERPDKLIALELGGKNPAFVAADAELEQTARALAFGAYVTAGQRCSGTSHVYIERPLADALIARLLELSAALRVGHVLEARRFMGPLISADAKAAVEAQLARAVALGFEPLAPGGPIDTGYHGHYLHPSLHLAPKRAVDVPGYTDEELFGPDLAVYIVDSLEEGLAREEASLYGLVASVFTASEPRFEALAAELDVGSVHWNRSSAGASSRLPFGGRRRSGNHRAGGVEMIRACVSPQARYERPHDTPGDPGALPSWPGLLDD